ncbi:MAG: Bug family tripartite tricarboxylate transporter substrate binding protein [Rhodospirillaceae bacterium]
MILLRTIPAGLLVCVLAALAAPASAQSYPNRAIRFVLPYAPGGGTDLTARPIAQKLSENYGKSVVVDNRPGGSGMIGAEIVARSAPDGYTVLVSASSEMSMNLALYKSMPYDPVKDFQPVTLATTTPAMLIAHPSVPVRSVKDLIALERAHPGSVSYASVGIGSPMHFAGELMNSMVKIKMAHVPYKGAGPAMVDLLGGHVPVGFVTVLAATQYTKSGRLRPLAVTSGKRAAGLPDIPTVAEAGLPGFDIVQWFAVWLPAHTPRDIVQKLHSDIAAIIHSAEYRQRMLESGTDAVGSSPEQLASFQASEIKKYRDIATAAQIRME